MTPATTPYQPSAMLLLLALGALALILAWENVRTGRRK